MLRNIVDYVSNHRGGFLQLGVGIAEFGIGHLLTPTENSSVVQVLQYAVASSIAMYGLVDICVGVPRSINMFKEREPKSLCTVLTLASEGCAVFYKSAIHPIFRLTI